MKQFVLYVALLLLVLLIALASEVSIFCYPLIRLEKKELHFLEPVNWAAVRIPSLCPPVANYDANYYYEYLSHSEPLTDWCATLSSEISKQFNARFIYVSAIYSFQCKHLHSFSTFQFIGPPMDHFLAIIPVHDGKNKIIWKKKKSTFRNTICVTPKDQNTCIELGGQWFLVAIIRPTDTGDVI